MYVREGLTFYIPGGEISVATAKALNWRYPSDYMYVHQLLFL